MASSQTFTLNIKALFDASDVKAKVGDIQSSLSKLKLPDKLSTDLNKSFIGVNKALDDFISRTEKGIKTKSDASGITKSFENVTKELNNLDNLMVKVKSQLGDGVDLSKIIKFDGSVKEQLEAINKQITELQQKINSINTSKLKDLQNSLSQIKSKGALGQGNKALELFKQGDLEGSLQVLNAIISKLEALKAANEAQGHNTSNITTSLEALRAMQTTVQEAQRETTGLVEQQNAKIAEGAQVARQAAEDYASALNNDIDALHQVSNETSGLTSKINDLAAGQAQFVREVDQVKSRIQYFFGLTNAINLVKRAIRGAVDTIKDLDKAMTETAVVTDFTVSDMWSQLPEYTKRANELGVTTQAAYEAATLYYQQGLNTEEVNALSVETLKMARIAGLDAAEATDRMTNALRGFNMELDTANAQRVDDVYSELAANTASNVDEISTAMTKVASLAHSANMEFETTAAFLAQIIETTRESAETAGTALKTVVARFSEVKKLVDTNQLKGQDEEGQVVDVNKVSAALRTAGIDLNKYFLGEVGLDDIFMELASKWDSLTSVQQRYIATQAAGSRQQSRFIALMQDYARTQELVGKAYNAEGASARQFEKTQESLESKLNRLKNAWNEFLMGLTNNVMVKTVVDLLTDLLNLVNKITSAFGDGAGSILKWAVALGTLGGLRRLFTDGGLATQLIGSLMGKGLGANKLRASMGLGEFDQAGQYRKYTTDELKQNRAPTIIGNIGQLGKTAWGAASKLGTKVATSNIGALLGMSSMYDGASLLGPIATGLTGIATAVGAIGAAMAAAYGVYQLWLHNSAEGKLKLATKEAKKLQETAQDSQDQLKSLEKFQDTYQEKTAQVSAATSVADREQAILERNQAILDAIQEDGTLAQYVITERTDFGIQLTVDEAGLKAAIADIGETARKAAIDAQFGEARVDFAEANVAEKNLRKLYQQQFMFAEDTQELSIDEVYERLRNDTVAGGQIQSEAAKLYSTILSERGAAETKARIAYGETLTGFGASKELTNALMPVLADVFGETQKQLSDESLKSILKVGDETLLKIADAYTGAEDFDIENLSSELSKALDDFADALGITTKQLKERIVAAQKERQEIKKTRQSNIYERLLRSGAANEQYTRGGTLDEKGSAATAVDYYTNFLNTLNEEGLAAVENITAQAESLLGDKLGEFMTELPKLYGTGDFQAISNLFKNINLNEPIQAFSQLQCYANDTTSAVGKYAAAIKEANAELFTSSNLVQSFIASADYEGITDKLADFIKENEAVTADNINELADSCADLAVLLDEDVASAQALAEAFTLLETGALTFDQITDAMLKALDAGKSFETVIAEVKGWIDDFDKGNDLKEGSEHVVSILEDLQKYVDNWEFGNEPVEKIYDHLFGEGKYQDFLSQWADHFNPEEAESILNGKIERFTQLFENEGLGAISELAGKIPGLTSLGNNFFDWDLSAIGSTKDAIKAVADQLQITEGAAESLILAWQTHIPGLRAEWNNLAFDEQVAAYAQNLDTASVVTEQQLSAIAAATGHTVDEIKAKLAELAGLGQIEMPIVVNWQDSDGNELTGDTLYQKFANAFGKWSNTNHMQVDWGTELANTVIQEYEDGIKAYDPSQVLSYFTDRGLSGAQATEMANRAIQNVKGIFSKEIEVPVVYKTEEDGKELYKTETKTITVEAETVEGLDAAVDTALQAANYESVASSIASQDFSGLSDNIAKAGEAGGERAAAAVTSAIEAQHPSVEVSVTYVATNPEVLSGGAGGGIVVSVAKGGAVKSYASGSAARRLSPGVALTGEEGPEIVWNKDKGYAYITGEQHPEFQDLQPGDRVFNAHETQKILKGSLANGGLIDSYASGGWKSGGDKSSGGGGGKSGSGGKEKTPDEWKNELDWLYNLMEDIAELERDQKAIEEQYEDYLQDQSKTGKDLYNLLIKQLGNLYTQLNHQTFALEKREQEMREFMDTTNDKDQYLWYNWQDRTLEIDWDAIDKITDEEEYKHVKELVDEAEEIQDKIDDADDAIMDITNQIQELENIWRDTFTDFEDRVYDAIVKSYQQVIDNYSELNDTLNNSNSQILDSLQKQISLQRQIRDNTKTEEEISDDEARLAYLRRDTTGGNDLAAMQLEKELADQRQDYEDTLVDQAISRLQEDNDAAAQQRQQQIDIMQAQLDYQSQNGEFNEYVRDLLTSAMGADGELLTNSDLVDLLKEQENWQAMSDVSKEVWDEELNGTFKEVAAFLLKQNAEENGTFYTALTKAVESVSTAIGSYSQAMTKLGNQISSVGSSGGSGGGGGGGGSSGGGAPAQSSSWDPKGLVKAESQKITINTQNVSVPVVGGRINPYTGAKTRYATGGLADFAGLAWLDGTPSEPEYVLNARQTDAFLKLADVLPNMMGNGGATSNTFGGSVFNVAVNVDSISSDYDVDRMVDRIKEKLYDDASYRNVNTLSFLR